MVNTDITSLFRMPRAPCFPHTRFCQINFDILRIIDSSLNFKCDTTWGRNSQSVLQSRVSENKGITPGRRSTLTWRKGFNQLRNLTDSDNRLNKGKSKKESNSVIGEPHVSHRGGTVPEPPSFPPFPTFIDYPVPLHNEQVCPCSRPRLIRPGSSIHHLPRLSSSLSVFELLQERNIF